MCIRDRGHLVHMDQAHGVHWQIGHLKALLLQGLAGVQHGVMLKNCGDQVLFALLSHGVGNALDGPVVRLGTASGCLLYTSRCV